MMGNRHGTLHMSLAQRPLVSWDILWIFAYCGVSLRHPATESIHVMRGERLTLESESELDHLLLDPAEICLQLWWPDGSDLMVTLTSNTEHRVLSYVYQSAGEPKDALLPPLWERAFYRYALEGAAQAMICDASGDSQEVDWEEWLRRPRPLPPPYPDLLIIPEYLASAFKLDQRQIHCEEIASKWVRVERARLV